MHWHYFRHDPSGESYAISIGDNGMFGDISGPLYYGDLTVEALIEGDFQYDEDDQDWMGSQSWHLMLPRNPGCDCEPALLIYNSYPDDTIGHTHAHKLSQ